MYFAGGFDFSSEAVSLNRAKTLKFPVRVPLEKLIQSKKRQREDDAGGSSSGSTANDDAASSVAAIVASLSSSSADAIAQLRNLTVSSVATGTKHAVCVINGAIYGIGANLSQQLGGGSMPQQLNSWRELSLTATNMGLTAPIVKVACGRKHTMALTSNGELYTTGSNIFSQLGHSNRRSDWAAVRVGTNNVVDICCGTDTSYALTSDGHVYSWGRGESLALGHPITRIEALHPTTLLPIYLNIDVPTRIEGFVTKRVKIVEISAGSEHLVARDETDVYTCGQNSFGKLGTGDVTDHLTPVRVKFPEKKTVEKLMQVMAFGRCTVVMKFNPDFGNLTYIFGKEGSSQDGTLAPRIVTEVPLTISRFVGGGAATQMCAAIDQDGLLYTWGHSSTMPTVLRTNENPHAYPAPVSYLADRCVVKDFAAANGALAVIIPDIDATLLRAAENLATAKKSAESDNATDASATSAGMTPDSLLRDVIVPYHLRIGTFGGATIGVDIHDQTVESFYKQLLGEVNGAAFIAAMEKPPPYDPNMFRPKIVKHGTRVLHNGSKVRVWMTDVYALGTITNANPLDLKVPDTPAANVSGRGSGLLQQASSGGLAGGSSQTGTPHMRPAAPPTEAALRNHHFEVTWVRDDWDPEILELCSDDETLDEENENRWQKLWFIGEPAANGSV